MSVEIRFEERASRQTPNCPYCRGEIPEGAPGIWSCPRCETRHHDACAREHGKCTLLGCGAPYGQALPATPTGSPLPFRVQGVRGAPRPASVWQSSPALARVRDFVGRAFPFALGASFLASFLGVAGLHAKLSFLDESLLNGLYLVGGATSLALATLHWLHALIFDDHPWDHPERAAHAGAILFVAGLLGIFGTLPALERERPGAGLALLLSTTAFLAGFGLSSAGRDGGGSGSG